MLSNLLRLLSSYPHSPAPHHPCYPSLLRCRRKCSTHIKPPLPSTKLFRKAPSTTTERPNDRTNGRVGTTFLCKYECYSILLRFVFGIDAKLLCVKVYRYLTCYPPFTLARLTQPFDDGSSRCGGGGLGGRTDHRVCAFIPSAGSRRVLAYCRLVELCE